MESEGKEFLVGSKNHDNDKKFRIQDKHRFFLTYKTHIHKERLRLFLTEKCGELKEFYAAHEHGKEGLKTNSIPYQHTHVCFWVEKGFNSQNTRVFDIRAPHLPNSSVELPIHPNIVSFGLQTKEDTRRWIRAVRYIAKEDPELKEKGLHENYMQTELDKIEKNFAAAVEGVLSSTTLAEAISEHGKKFSDIIGIKTLFELKQPKRKRTRAPKIPTKWQEEFIASITPERESCRTIQWIYDKPGSGGKTSCVDFAKAKFGAEYLHMEACGKLTDVAQLVKGHHETTGEYPRIFSLDLARTFVERDSVYTVIEKLADGKLTAFKYKSSSEDFVTDHVVVFANFLPDVSKLSLDRWDIKEVCHKSPCYEGGDLCMHIESMCPREEIFLKKIQTKLLLQGDNSTFSASH